MDEYQEFFFLSVQLGYVAKVMTVIAFFFFCHFLMSIL